MDNEIKTTVGSADSVRVFGRLILVAGIVFIAIAQLTDISVNYTENFDPKTLLELPKKIADKTNFTLLGGLLIIVGLQLSLVSNQVITEIIEQFKRPIPKETEKEDSKDLDDWD